MEARTSGGSLPTTKCTGIDKFSNRGQVLSATSRYRTISRIRDSNVDVSALQGGARNFKMSRTVSREVRPQGEKTRDALQFHKSKVRAKGRPSAELVESKDLYDQRLSTRLAGSAPASNHRVNKWGPPYKLIAQRTARRRASHLQGSKPNPSASRRHRNRFRKGCHLNPQSF